jgi:hypothetical protein
MHCDCNHDSHRTIEFPNSTPTSRPTGHIIPYVSSAPVRCLFSTKTHLSSPFTRQRCKQVVAPTATTALCIFQTPESEFGWQIAVGYDTGVWFKSHPHYKRQALFEYLHQEPLNAQRVTLLIVAIHQAYCASCTEISTPSYTTCSGHPTSPFLKPTSTFLKPKHPHFLKIL